MILRRLSVGLLVFGLVGTPLTASARPIVTSLGDALAQDVYQKVETADRALMFELPFDWTVFDMAQPGIKTQIQAKIDDGTISKKSGETCLKNVKKKQYKIFAFAPKSESGFASGMNAVIGKQEGDLATQRRELQDSAATHWLTIIADDLTDNMLRFTTRHDTDGPVPFLVGQVMTKPADEVYILTFSYPVSDADTMSKVMDHAIKSLATK